MIKVFATGRVGSDADFRNENDKPRCRFRFCAKEGFGDSETEQWFTVKAFGGKAKYLGQAARKGQFLVLVGRYGIETWTDKAGDERTDVCLYVDDQDAGPKQESREDSDDGGRW